MHKHTPSPIERILDESIASGEVFDQIVVVHIVDLDHEMFEIFEQVVLQWPPQNGQNVRDTGVL